VNFDDEIEVGSTEALRVQLPEIPEFPEKSLDDIKAHPDKVKNSVNAQHVVYSSKPLADVCYLGHYALLLALVLFYRNADVVLEELLFVS
jgi:hypothetical protein